MNGKATGELFDGMASSGTETLAEGAVLLRGFASDAAATLLQEIEGIAKATPFRHMVTPGGYRMSVAMTNCGEAGWLSDRRGYRYGRDDPETGRAWPAMPACFLKLAARAARAGGYRDFVPDSCLINRYEPGSKLSLHQDKDEGDFGAPIVSVSLGVPAVFLFGGERRRDPTVRIRLNSGDVAVWGGPARLAHHGIAPLADGYSPLAGNLRYNLTLRKAL